MSGFFCCQACLLEFGIGQEFKSNNFSRSLRSNKFFLLKTEWVLFYVATFNSRLSLQSFITQNLLNRMCISFLPVYHAQRSSSFCMQPAHRSQAVYNPATGA